MFHQMKNKMSLYLLNLREQFQKRNKKTYAYVIDPNNKSLIRVKELLPVNPIIVEAGAYNGCDTTVFSRVWPQGKVFAFEPIPNIYKQLVQNTIHIKNVHCYQMALSNQVGESTMFVSSGGSDASSSLLEPTGHILEHPQVSFDDTVKVRTTTLDYWCRQNNIKSIDMLWLDLQGNEFLVLEASENILERTKVIHTEVSLKEMYKGSILYNEFRDWLEKRRFQVVFEDLQWEDMGNVIFLNKNLVA